MRVRIVSDGTDRGTSVTDVETGALLRVVDYWIDHPLGDVARATLVVFAEVDVVAEVVEIVLGPPPPCRSCGQLP